MRSISMIKIREILRLKSLGIGIRATAESCNCSRNTVREVLRTAELQGIIWPLPEEMDDFKLTTFIYPLSEEPASRKPEPDYQHIHNELKHHHVNLRLLWTEYRSLQPDGLAYSQFCNRYSTWAAKTKAVMHIDRKPGDEMFVDWAGIKMKVIDRETGEILEAHLFVSTIGASAYPYVEAFPSECLENWITAHVHALEYYSGVPRQLVPDNLKTGVKKACNYDPELNKTYLELSEHYGCAIVPARSGKPKDKAPVEGTVGNISTWIAAALRHQRFFSFHEINLAIREKLKEYSETPFQKKDGSRRSAFVEIDLPVLKQLPLNPYEMATWKVATVSFNYHIEVYKMYYSILYTYIQRKVDVRITASVIEIYSNNVRICSHQRLRGKAGQYSTNPEHMPPNHREYVSWDGSRFLAWACKIGDNTRELVQQVLASRKIEQQAYKACFGLLKLADRYTAFRLENACQKALALKSPSYTTINNILKNGMDKVIKEPTAIKNNIIPISSNIRGAGYYAKGGQKK
jgi:transposase